MQDLSLAGQVNENADEESHNAAAIREDHVGGLMTDSMANEHVAEGL